MPELVLPPTWMADSPCATTDPDLFHPVRGAAPPAAKDMCWNTCTVREECLEWALNFETGHGFGIFGGLSATERRKIRKERA